MTFLGYAIPTNFNSNYVGHVECNTNHKHLKYRTVTGSEMNISILKKHNNNIQHTKYAQQHFLFENKIHSEAEKK